MGADTPSRRFHRRFTDEFKAHAVQMILDERPHRPCDVGHHEIIVHGESGSLGPARAASSRHAGRDRMQGHVQNPWMSALVDRAVVAKMTWLVAW